jgi:lipid-binding SYLF domain-containing protein
MKALKTCFVLMLAPATFGVLALPGCATSPPTQQAKENLSDESHAAFNSMMRTDPSLNDFINNKGYAYAIFPSVGKGAAGVGGAYGRGEVYEQNKFIGYADMTQGSIGAQLGGETYSELVVFENKTALDKLMNNKMAFEAKASAVAAKAGAGTAATFINGVAVFTHPKGGLMFDASIGGQQFTFTPAQTENQ